MGSARGCPSLGCGFDSVCRPYHVTQSFVVYVGFPVRVRVTPVAGSIFRPLSQTHISKREFKNGHISRFCSVFQVIQVISSAKFFSAAEVDLSFKSETKEHPRFRTLLFGKETVKTFFYKCSNLGKMNPLHKNKVMSVGYQVKQNLKSRS